MPDFRIDADLRAIRHWFDVKTTVTESHWTVAFTRSEIQVATLKVDSLRDEAMFVCGSEQKRSSAFSADQLAEWLLSIGPSFDHQRLVNDCHSILGIVESWEAAIRVGLNPAAASLPQELQGRVVIRITIDTCA
jgi:hypothetical protein